MNFKQSFVLAIKSLSASKMRSFLTMLGIIIGVASVIILVSIVDGMKNKITNIFEDMGTNLITVNIMGRGSSRTVSPEDMLALAEKNPEALAACSPFVQLSNSTVKVGNQNTGTSVVGVSERYNDIRNVEVESGRFLEYIDIERKQKVCLVGTFIVKELFDEKNPIGQSIKIQNDVYTVVGVLKEVASGEEDSEDDKVIIPYTNASRISQVGTYFFSAKSDETVPQAMAAIQNALFKVYANTNRYRVSSMDEMLDTVNEMSGILTAVLAGVAGISLLVGGIGIMNIMLVSVTERTREIGIRKSLGAKRKDIMSQFIVEAATTSAAGGIIGIVLGGFASVGAGKLMSLEVVPSVGAVIIAFSVSAIIGMTFGYFPASKASKLNPIEALRYD